MQLDLGTHVYNSQTVGADRILFGSDRVGFPAGAPGDWLDLWRSLLDEPDDGSPSFTQAEILAILGANADREYRLGLLEQAAEIEVWPPFPAKPFRYTARDSP